MLSSCAGGTSRAELELLRSSATSRVYLPKPAPAPVPRIRRGTAVAYDQQQKTGLEAVQKELAASKAAGHYEGAAIAFEVPLDKVTKEQRLAFKERFFSFAYARNLATPKASIPELIKLVAEHMRSSLR